jgi:hypothetical protein
MSRPAAIIAVALCLLGCGYRALVGNPQGRIEIRTFENESAEPGFEQLLVDAFTEEFARRGRLEPVFVSGPDPAEFRIDGVVRDIQVVPTSFSSVGLEIEGRVTVHLEIRMRRASELLWTQRIVVFEQFLSSADAQIRESNKEQALQRLASDVAGRIHDELDQSI